MRFSKFGLASIVIGLIILAAMYYTVFGGATLPWNQALTNLVLATITGAVSLAGIILLVVGILLFVI